MSMKLFQPLSFAIGLRYLRAKRRNGFISFIPWPRSSAS